MNKSPLLREASVHRALDVVEQSSQPITALELALAVGVSQRTLEHGFRELLGVTPAAYLRRRRMNGARHYLAHGDPDWTTVTRIALDWGFSHPGRFSAAYLALFGELPSRTLNRTPSKALCRPLSQTFEPIR
ncbi:MAG: helix-turn-helix transcriptional regulator [Rhodospirillales bacterium]|nr:helix-turn-helix transcriptional regulator [Rhodospirillales bacterium]MDH3793121.1 helix-turn-helix transcriptional regulator [Rhodospirillales bacterium]MDH3913913.1 helix-turn-helix transcriptional regulator [Rhodospirillales bacterium]MDH3968313.1 helix-turn-helix transcriptional regulator [Rhodospirillales bacterium]